MIKSDRDKLAKIIKANAEAYLATASTHEKSPILESKFNNLYRKTRILIRKEYDSENSLNGLSRVGRLVSGLMEYIKQSKLPYFDFTDYKKVVNDYLLHYLESRRPNKYNGQCQSYGETLFVLYLDLFISATMYKPERKLQANPPFLINPRTGSLLEVDAFFEEFRLGFEFQGEHHYTNPITQTRDVFKLQESRKNKVILIPVNISQLNGRELQNLIVNSIKDFLEIHDLFLNRDSFKLSSQVNRRQLANFCKVAERLYTASAIFDSCMQWLDKESENYIRNVTARSPISSTTPAPRQIPSMGDFDIEFVYRNLKYVANIKKKP